MNLNIFAIQGQIITPIDEVNGWIKFTLRYETFPTSGKFMNFPCCAWNETAKRIKLTLRPGMYITCSGALKEFFEHGTRTNSFTSLLINNFNKIENVSETIQSRVVPTHNITSSPYQSNPDYTSKIPETAADVLPAITTNPFPDHSQLSKSMEDNPLKQKYNKPKQYKMEDLVPYDEPLPPDDDIPF